MRLSIDAVNRVLDAAGIMLSNGVLQFYAGNFPPTRGAQNVGEPLVEIPLLYPAFEPAVDGRAMGHELMPMPVAVTGDAGWARLLSHQGDIVADLTVRQADAPDADTADIVVDRIDFHRGGLCRVAPLVLTMSRLSC